MSVEDGVSNLDANTMNKFVSSGGNLNTNIKACAILLNGTVSPAISGGGTSHVSGFGLPSVNSGVITAPFAGGNFADNPTVTLTLQKSATGPPAVPYTAQLLTPTLIAQLKTEVTFCIQDASGAIVTSTATLTGMLVHIMAVGRM